jgi:hypothetical protein
MLISEKQFAERDANLLVNSGRPIQNRMVICVPVTGLVRVEWMMARYGQLIPVNWSASDYLQYINTFSPLSYAVDDARNMSVQFAIEKDFEWVFFLDHDVVLPQDAFVRINEYVCDGKYPVVCGLYNTKSMPPEPLLFRGKGNSWYRDWKPGDKVWVDGIPMGCTLISVKLLKAMWEVSEQYMRGDVRLRKVFHTPRKLDYDETSNTFKIFGGTEDLWWCDRVIEERWLEKSGFTEVAGKEFPFLCDTNIKCGHITQNGVVY